MHRIHTCVDLLHHIEAHHSNPKALNYRHNDEWRSMSTQEFLQTVKELALGLIDLGMQKGERVGILSTPTSYWTVADFAIMMAGGVTVPLFANISDEHFQFQVKQTKMKLVLVNGHEQWEMYHRNAALFNRAIHLSPDSLGPISETRVTELSEILKFGKDLNETMPTMYEELQQEMQNTSLAAIIYTSGSSGTPKGVELTQENICCQLHHDDFQWDAKKDRYLSVLPLEHVFGHSVNFWVLFWGVSIYYTTDYKNVGLICTQIKPTCLIVVPRLLEKVHASMVAKVQKSSGVKYIIGKLALRLAHQTTVHPWQKPMIPLLNCLVYSKFRLGLGGKLRVIICGGAHLAPHLQQFFDKIGLNVYEGWGMTEACPVCINVPTNHKIGTVGPALEGQQLQISPEGEILVKGPLVMKGYYLNPNLTSQTIDAQGWLHTGDKGSIDEAGRLTISGRIKELYKTSTGEYVAPIPIEQALSTHPLIDASMVVAEGKKFTTVLLFPNIQVLEQMKSEQGQTNISDEQFLQSQYIVNEMNDLLRSVNKKLNHWEQLRAYRFVLKPLSVRDGELTPSMKLKRETITKKNHKLIDTMYEEEIQ